MLAEDTHVLSLIPQAQAQAVHETSDDDGDEIIEGIRGRILAVEVLCPLCEQCCVEPETGTLSITADLRGKLVVCSRCHIPYRIPSNAFSR